MMRVLIADDERVARRGVRRMLADLPNLHIVGEATSGVEAVSAIRSQPIDVVLLDISMPGMSGLDVVAAIGPEHMPFVIFVTAYDQHAVRAFELHALDYIVKPFSEERLRQAIERARDALRRDAAVQLQKLSGWLQQSTGASHERGRTIAPRLRIEQDGVVRFIAMRDIRWIEAQDYCVLLHLDRERILRRGTLKRVLEILDPRLFVRVHRSAAVNVRHVRDLVLTPSGGLTARLTDGTEVPVTSTHREELEARLAESPG